MADSITKSPSFTPRRKWSIGFNVFFGTIAVFAILVAANYLSGKYFFKRFYLSAHTRIALSPRTINLLNSLTNQVDVIVYYDKDEPFYSDITGLLKEYQAHNRKLTVKTVDYYRNPGTAAEVKQKYNLGSSTNKDFVIFDCEGRKLTVDGNRLSSYSYNFEPSKDKDDPKLYVNRKRTAFNGETLFSSALFAVSQTKPLKAYFLQGHGEPSPRDENDVQSYGKLSEIFHANYVQTDTIENLLGTNAIPLDCNLLVITSPRMGIPEAELGKISQYLDQGGRLLTLFDLRSIKVETGLEKILAKWNVNVSHDVVRDLDFAGDDKGQSFFVSALALHDITKPLIGSRLEIILPRPISRITAPSQAGTDEPQVTELAFSSATSVLANNPSVEPRAFPLMVAVEKAPIKGVVTERGTTRMLIAGDSLFLDNQVIDVTANRDFADSAINWLLERTALLGGIGPRPVTEYRLQMDNRQLSTVKGILLGAIPGGILLFGGLVWLRRRK